MGFAEVLFSYQTIPAWYLPHTDAGLRRTPVDELSYAEFFEDPRRRVAVEDLFEFDVRRHTYRDLCRFLNVSLEDAACTNELLPHDMPNYGWMEWMYPKAAASVAAVMAVLHWVQYRLLWWSFRCICRRRSADHAKDD
eukprot:SRR837773.26814.p1 GENE.SRR837773.26814~~SRR837773.26814.p1  ORF type:complete len:152 (+),score=30.01 SRR837773.26814:44-457(+)